PADRDSQHLARRDPPAGAPRDAGAGDLRRQLPRRARAGRKTGDRAGEEQRDAPAPAGSRLLQDPALEAAVGTRRSRAAGTAAGLTRPVLLHIQIRDFAIIDAAELELAS